MNRKILALVVILVVGASLLWWLNEQPGGLQIFFDLEAGFTPLSLTNIQYGYDPELTEDVFMLTFAQTPADTFIALMDFTDISIPGHPTEERVALKTIIDEQKCTFDIADSTVPRYIYKVSSSTEGEPIIRYAPDIPFMGCIDPIYNVAWTNSFISNWCAGYGGDKRLFLWRDMGTQCIAVCYPLELSGVMHDKLGGQLETTSVFIVEKENGDTIQTAISDETLSSYLRNPDTGMTYGKITRAGYLWSGTDCDAKITEEQLDIVETLGVGLRTTAQQYWYDYTSFDQRLANEIEDCQGLSDEAGCYNDLGRTYNTQANRVLNGATFYATEGGTSTPILISNGVLQFNANKLIGYPVFTAILKASWVALIEQVGEPDIISASSECFSVGQIGGITVEVKNVGDSPGVFYAVANCPQPFTVLGNAVTDGTLPPGETDTLVIPIRTYVTADETATCEVTVYDVGNPDNFDGPIDVEVCAEETATCPTPYRCYQEGDTWYIQECQNGVYVSIEECEIGCKIGDTGIPVCEGTPPTCGNGDCEPEFGETKDNCPSDCFFLPPIPEPELRLIFTLIGFGIGVLVGFKVFKRNQPTSRLPFYKQRWFYGTLISGAIVALVFWLIFPTVMTIIDVAIPTFDCQQWLPHEYALCMVKDFVLLIAWVIVAFIIIKLLL